MSGSGAHEGGRPARPWASRARELESLERAADEAREGRGGFVRVTGEPGIGKTRFVEEAARRLRERGFRVLWGRAWEEPGSPPYWPWVQILRQSVRALPRDVLAGASAGALAGLVSERREAIPAPAAPRPDEDFEAERFFLFEAVTGLLTAAAGREPLLIVIDDLPSADPGSLLLLRFVVRHLGGVRILVVVTERDGGESAPTETSRLLGDLRRESVEVPLGGLGEGEVGELLARVLPGGPSPRVVRRVREVTRGNPFFVEEIARCLAPADGSDDVSFPVPEGIRQAVRRRLAVLSPDCLELLSLALVIGRSFDLLLLRELAGFDGAPLVERLAEASRLDVVRPAAEPAGEYSFVHELVRETLYEDLPVARRLELHRRVGMLLEARSPPEDRPLGALAHHFFQAREAGGAAQAAEYGFLAGRAAEAQLAWEEAVRRFSDALAAMDAGAPAGDGARVAGLLHLGENQRRVGERDAAARVLERAAALARRLGDVESEARAVLGIAAVSGGPPDGLDATGRVDPVLVRRLEEALGRLPRTDSPLRSRLLGRLATALYWAPDARERSAALSAEAVDVARRLGDRAALAAALTSRRYACWSPDDLEERQRTASEALRLAREGGDPARELRVAPWRLWDHLECGRADEARRVREEHERLAERVGQPFDLGTAALFRSLFATIGGRFAEARSLAARAFALGTEAGNPTVSNVFGAQAFVLAWEEGRLSTLEDAMSHVLAQHDDLPAARTIVALVWAELGRTEAARAELDRLAARDFRDLPRDLAWMLGMASLALTCVRLGDSRRAGLLYEMLRPYAGRWILVGPPPVATLGPVEWHLGRLAHVAGNLDVACGHLERAHFSAGRMGAPGYVARAAIARAAAFADRGDALSAAVQLDSGRATARALGMHGLEAEADALDARLGDAAARREVRDPRLLRREGDFWLVVWEGKAVRVEDAKGMRYLARLLRHPGEEFHVADLVRILAPQGSREELRPGHAGEDLDDRATFEYRRRLQELEEAAGEDADVGTVDAIRFEADFIRRELAVAHGLGGRRRRSVDDVERLRKTVSSRIRQSAERIGQVHPELGRHLRGAIQTGTFCSYSPRLGGAWTVEE